MAKDDAARRERLKAALRENLRRRKTQARERAKGSDANRPDGSGLPPDGTGEPGSVKD